MLRVSNVLVYTKKTYLKFASTLKISSQSAGITTNFTEALRNLTEVALLQIGFVQWNTNVSIYILQTKTEENFNDSLFIFCKSNYCY